MFISQLESFTKNRARTRKLFQLVLESSVDSVLVVPHEDYAEISKSNFKEVKIHDLALIHLLEEYGVYGPYAQYISCCIIAWPSHSKQKYCTTFYPVEVGGDPINEFNRFRGKFYDEGNEYGRKYRELINWILSEPINFEFNDDALVLKYEDKEFKLEELERMLLRRLRDVQGS